MNDWLNKLANEQKLSPQEELQLDAALAEQERSETVDAVRSMTSFEAPEGVLAGFDRAMARRSRMRFASAFGACAAAIAVFVALDRPEVNAPAPTAVSADSLYEWHNEAVATSVLPGDGASLSAFSQVARTPGENQ